MKKSKTDNKDGGSLCPTGFIEFFELESRVMYSASPIDVEAVETMEAVEGLFEFAEADPLSQLSTEESATTRLGVTESLVQSFFNDPETGNQDSVPLDSGLADPQNEIVFVLSDVANSDELLADISPDAEVVFVDATASGFSQITTVLAEKTNITAIHIVSHGSDGAAFLGADELTTEFVRNNETQFSVWQNAMSDGGDILFYGCNLAESNTGQELLTLLAVTCDCDVAASDDVTGHADLSGDWELEYQVGAIESSVFVSESARHEWVGSLATFTVVDAGDSGVGTFRWAIDQANANSGVDTIEFAIPSAASFETISLSASLEITERVILDATTQTGYTGSPLIELDGSAIGAGNPILRIASGADSTFVSGFAFVNGVDTAISIESDGNQITSNYVGLSADGVTAKGNNNGINITGDNNSIGVGSLAESNIISGNSGYGIRLGGSASGNQILGNSIGLDAQGNALGNAGRGIFVQGNAANNQIGGVANGEGNIIANSGDDGVGISANTIGNTVRGNEMFQNGSSAVDLNIDLDIDGITENDISVFTNDDDTGPNQLQNFPDITAAIYDGKNLRIVGSATGSNNTNYIYDFYFGSTLFSNGLTDAEAYVGSVNGRTSLAGFDDFNFIITNPAIALGGYLTATATHSDGSTSEFSQAIQIVSSTDGLLFTTAGDVDTPTSQGVDSWNTEEILVFGSPSDGDYSLGNGTTDGAIGKFWDIGSSTLGTANVTALHFVRSDLTIGTGTNSFDLQKGDILFANSESSRDYFGTNGTTSADSGDLLVYRPTSLETYAGGEFHILLDNPYNQDIHAVTLVESAPGVDLGDGTKLAQGTFLFSTSGGGARDVLSYVVDETGEGTTSGTSSRLVDGSDGDVGISVDIQSLAIVEESRELGGILLNEGDILFSIESADAVGQNGVDLDVHDVGIMEVVSVDTGGNSSNATVQVLFDGSNVGLTGSTNAIHSFSLTPNLSAPTSVGLSNDRVDENQDSATGVRVGTLSTVDLDSSSFTYEVVAGFGDADKFSIGGLGNDELVLSDTSLAGAILDFETIESYEVRVRSTDADGLSVTRDLTIEVNDLNEAPELAPQSFDVNEGSTLIGNIAANDPDALANLTYSITGIGQDEGRFSIDSATGELSFLTAQDFEAPADGNLDNIYTLDVTVSDGALQDTSTITVRVNNLNEAPAVFAQNFEIDENTTEVGLILASDPDSPTTFSYSILPSGFDESLFAIDSTTGALRFISAPDFESPSDGDANNRYVLEVSVSDGALQNTATISVDVRNALEAPTVTIPNRTVTEDSPSFVYDLSSHISDPEDLLGDLQVEVMGNTNPGLFPTLLVDGNNNLSVSLAPNQNGSSEIRIRVTDSDGLATESSFQLFVTPENDDPVALDTIDDFTASTGSSRNIDLSRLFDDVDILPNGDSLTLTVSTTDPGVATGIISGDNLKLDFHADGKASFQITATDNNSQTAEISFAVNSVSTNIAPAIDPAHFSIDENPSIGDKVGVVTAYPGGTGDSVTFTIVGGTGEGVFGINSTTGQLTVLTPDAVDFETNPKFELHVQVTDTIDLKATEVVSIQVNDVDEAPEFDRTVLLHNENEIVVGALPVHDDEGDPIAFSIVGGIDSAFFLIDANSGELRFVSAPDFETPLDGNGNNFYRVIVSATSEGQTTTATVRVGVENVNEAPTTIGIADQIVNEDSGILTIDLTSLFDDVDAGDKLNYSITTADGRGEFYKARQSDGTLKIAPIKDQNGSGTLVISVVDDGNLSTSASFEYTVTPENDAPVGQADSFVLRDGTLQGENLLANDVDVDGNNLTAVLVSSASNGRVQINPDGSFIYQPNDGFAGQDVFSYLVSDGSLNSEPIRVVVDVLPAVNVAPPSIDVTDSTSEDDSESTESETAVEEDKVVNPNNTSASIELGIKQGSDTQEGQQTVLKSLNLTKSKPTKIEANQGFNYTIVYVPSTAEQSRESLKNEFSSTDIFDQTSSSEAIVGNRWMWQALDQYQNQVAVESNLPVAILGGTAGVASSLSVGYLIWLIRGGNILAAVMANLPAWSLIDPLPVLSRLDSFEEGVENDSLESILENSEAELDGQNLIQSDSMPIVSSN